MMRKIKKLTALMLAIVMVLAMSITAFASEVEGGDTNEPSTTPEAMVTHTSFIRSLQGYMMLKVDVFLISNGDRMEQVQKTN